MLDQVKGISGLFILQVPLQCSRIGFLPKLCFEPHVELEWLFWMRRHWGTLQLPVQMVVKHQLLLFPANCHLSKTLLWLPCNLALPSWSLFPSCPSSPEEIAAAHQDSGKNILIFWIPVQGSLIKKSIWQNLFVFFSLSHSLFFVCFGFVGVFFIPLSYPGPWVFFWMN